MPFKILRQDITKMEVDAIVNAANASLLGGGGVDGAIHAAAGPGLLAECRTLGGCEPGQAKATGGYSLPAKYVIHTVGPIWQGGHANEETTLRACYRNSLRLAEEKGCESVAFPLISAGAYGYPKDEAFSVALSEIGAFLLGSEMTVFLVLFGSAETHLGRSRFPDLQSFIDQSYVDAHYSPNLESARFQMAHLAPPPSGFAPPAPAAAPAKKEKKSRRLFHKNEAPTETAVFCAEDAFEAAPAPIPAPSAKPDDLDAAISGMLDESFSEMLLRLIDERGLTDAAVYKKANVDRKLFSKIRSNPLYRPSKPTAVAFAVALELSEAETRELLQKAGYALSRAYLFDVIIEYFISRGNYNVFDINEALFSYDQTLLGA